MKRKYLPLNRLLLALAFGTVNALAADGTWILNGNGNWSNNTSAWSGNVIADGVGATATFTLNLSANRNFTFDTTSRTLGTLNTSATGRSSNFLTSGGAILTLDNTGSTNAVINVDAASGQNHNINVPIQLMDSLDITNGLTSASGKSLIMNNTMTVKSGASNSGNLTITNNSTLGGTPMTNFNGLISDGAGSITLVNAAGIMNIANAGNTFSGTTTNTSGIIRIDNATALQNSALNTTGSITGSATEGLRLNTGVTTLTLGGLTGSKNINASGTGVFSTASSNYGSVTALTLKPITGKSETYSGAIENGAAGMSLTKSGAGTQTLTGTNLYTGATNVNQGTLAVTGSGSINTTSGITVAAGAKFLYNSSTALTVAPSLSGSGTSNRATLGGNGTVNATITLDNVGDTLSPGNSPGTLSFTPAQTWNSFSYDWEVNNFTGTTAGTDFDQITVGNTVNFTGGSGSYILNILSLTALNAGGDVPNFSEVPRSWTILTSTGITGFNPANWTVDPAGFTNLETGAWSVTQSGNSLLLNYTTIPEPGAALLGGLGFLALLRRRRN